LWDLYRRSSRIKFCYLRSEFETCWARLELSPEVRPLVLRGKSELQKIYHERQQLFNQIPWVLLNEGQRSREELALEFWQKLTD
jgi:shikimate kinase